MSSLIIDTAEWRTSDLIISTFLETRYTASLYALGCLHLLRSLVGLCTGLSVGPPTCAATVTSNRPAWHPLILPAQMRERKYRRETLQTRRVTTDIIQTNPQSPATRVGHARPQAVERSNRSATKIVRAHTGQVKMCQGMPRNATPEFWTTCHTTSARIVDQHYSRAPHLTCK